MSSMQQERGGGALRSNDGGMEGRGGVRGRA